MVEVFIDMVPLAARTFVNRCRPGSTGSFQGTAVHKALRGLAVYIGLSNKCAEAKQHTLWIAYEPQLGSQSVHACSLGRVSLTMQRHRSAACIAAVHRRARRDVAQHDGCCKVAKRMTFDDSVCLDWSRFVVGVPLRPSPYLRHVESGTVSISSTGQELAFGLARSLTLDATHLVIAPTILMFYQS